MDDGIRLLHVEDDADFAALATDLLESMAADLSVTTESTVADALARFDAERFDCLVTDHDLPDGTGIDLLEAVRDRDEEVPVLLFTGEGTEAVASDAFSAGATDYLRKRGGTEQFRVLANRVENAVEARRARTQRERRLAAIETASEGIAIIDADTDEFVYVNDAYADIYGYEEPAEMVGEHWSLVYPDDEVDFVAEEVVPAVETAGHWHGTTTGLRADGTTFVEDHTLSLSADGDLICTIRDVTDQRERAADLARYRTVVQALGDPVYTVDEDGTITFVNDAYVELTGYDRAALVGEHVSTLVDTTSLERGRAAIRRLLSGEAAQASYEMTVETSDGGTVRCEDNLSLLPMDDGEFRGHAGVLRDITERTEREYELRRYKQMANAAADMVYVLDDRGRIEFVNDAATELTGYDRDTLVGSHVGLFMNETDVYRGRELVQRLLDPDAPDSDAYEWTLYTADGETVPCESHISVVGDADGLEGTTGVVRDVSDRKEQERALRRQNDRLEEFASIVTHDLRNPLEVAQTRLGLLAEETESEHVEHVRTALDRMEDIVDDTLTLARQGEAVDDPEPIEVGNLVRNCWTLVETPGADLSVTPFSAEGDPERLKQVFENLFRNSVEHGSPGSRTESDDTTGDDDVTVTVAPLSSEQGFYVADDGRGIPADQRDRVFEGGYSVADDGSGFGLSIVRTIVEAHGWAISVTESETGGARFEVTGVDSLSRD